jgi:glyoxylase-like metal-dependent hydrolase (beta-lactamase superfamily II)
MKPVRADLWETATFSPFPGLTTHAYLWTPPDAGNVLFYAPGDDSDLDAIDELGGIAVQYLSHRDEAGPTLARVAERFGAELRSHAAELDDVAHFRTPTVTFERRHLDEWGIEVVPTPGHSPGSTCYLVPGSGGATYLFTGDTLYRRADGRWTAGYIAGYSDATALAASLELIATFEPTVVISSAFAGDRAVHDVEGRWADLVAEAIGALVPR